MVLLAALVVFIIESFAFCFFNPEHGIMEVVNKHKQKKSSSPSGHSNNTLVTQQIISSFVILLKREGEALWLCSVIFLAGEMCCAEVRLREKTADVKLWQSSLPWICINKAAEGKCHLHINTDGPAWMNNYCALTQVREVSTKPPKPLTLKPFQMGSPASWHVIRRWQWGGCDMPRFFGNEKIFLVAKRSGKWNDSPQQLSACSFSKRRDGDTGLICEDKGGGRTSEDWLTVLS